MASARGLRSRRAFAYRRTDAACAKSRDTGADGLPSALLDLSGSPAFKGTRHPRASSFPVEEWLVRLNHDAQTIVDTEDAAQTARLRYVTDARPSIRRRKSGKGFTYTRADGSRLREPDVLRRIKSLAIPPAWTDVWICPFADGLVQATGRDAKDRKQYRYHPRFREVRDSTKYEHVVAFAEPLPTIRARVREHMALRGLPLKTRHAAVDGNEVRCRFTGKSGKQWCLRERDRRIAKIIRACQELPGQELLQYLDDEMRPQDVTSSDVNAYLKEIIGEDNYGQGFSDRGWDGTGRDGIE